MSKISRRLEKRYCELCEIETSHIVELARVKTELTTLPVVTETCKCTRCKAISQQRKILETVKR